MLYGANTAEVLALLSTFPRHSLAEWLTEIYFDCFCNNLGEFEPDESKAADSAADFVEAVDMLFQRIDSFVSNKTEQS